MVRLALKISACVLLSLCVAGTTPARADLKEVVAGVLEYLGLGGKPPTQENDRPLSSVPQGDIFKPLPVLDFAIESRNIRIVEGDEAEVTVRLKPVSDQEVRFTMEPVGSLDGATFFEATRKDMVIPPGADMVSARFKTTDDNTYSDRTRSFIVRLVRPEGLIAMNARIANDGNEAIVTVLENDRPTPPPPPPARLVSSQSVVSFGDVLAGRSIEREILITNAGERPTTPGPVQFSPRGPFVDVFDECAGRALGPGRSCAVTISFQPRSVGAHSTLMSIRAPAGSVDVTLEGRARAPVVVEDPMAARVAALRAQRSVDDGRVKSFEIPPVPENEKSKYSTTDPDWGVVGIGRTYFSLKVDRSRIISVDRIIPCVLEDTIRSEIPGPVVCQVERHVFGANGRLVLIPAGSRVVGNYESLASQGDTRLNVVWQRFFRPDGSSVAIGDGFQGADMAGSTGLPGHIDKRILERFSTPVLLTVLSAAATALVPADNDQFASAATNLTEGIGDVATQLLEENLDIRSTMTVPSGSRISIKPLVDLWFPRADRIEPVALDEKKQTSPGG